MAAKQIQNSRASIQAIREFRTNIFLKPNKHVAVEVYLVDDRGKKQACGKEGALGLVFTVSDEDRSKMALRT